MLIAGCQAAGAAKLPRLSLGNFAALGNSVEGNVPRPCLFAFYIALITKMLSVGCICCVGGCCEFMISVSLHVRCKSSLNVRNPWPQLS